MVSGIPLKVTLPLFSEIKHSSSVASSLSASDELVKLGATGNRTTARLIAIKLELRPSIDLVSVYPLKEYTYIKIH